LLQDDQLILALVVFAAAAYFALTYLRVRADWLSIILFAAVAVFALPYLPLVFAVDAITGLALLAMAVIAAQFFLGMKDYVNIAVLLLFVLVVGSAFAGLG